MNVSSVPSATARKPDLDKQLVGIFGAARPAPTHAQPLGLHDFEIFAAALMLARAAEGSSGLAPRGRQRPLPSARPPMRFGGGVCGLGGEVRRAGAAKWLPNGRALAARHAIPASRECFAGRQPDELGAVSDAFREPASSRPGSQGDEAADMPVVPSDYNSNMSSTCRLPSQGSQFRRDVDIAVEVVESRRLLLRLPMAASGRLCCKTILPVAARKI